MKVWITKYALSRGIYSAEAKVCEDTDGKMIKAAGGHYFHKPHWHETREAACAQAVQMAASKLASLERQSLKIKKARELWRRAAEAG